MTMRALAFMTLTVVGLANADPMRSRPQRAGPCPSLEWSPASSPGCRGQESDSAPMTRIFPSACFPAGMPTGPFRSRPHCASPLPVERLARCHRNSAAQQLAGCASAILRAWSSSKRNPILYRERYGTRASTERRAACSRATFCISRRQTDAGRDRPLHSSIRLWRNVGAIEDPGLRQARGGPATWRVIPSSRTNYAPIRNSFPRQPKNCCVATRSPSRCDA